MYFNIPDYFIVKFYPGSISFYGILDNPVLTNTYFKIKKSAAKLVNSC